MATGQDIHSPNRIERARIARVAAIAATRGGRIDEGDLDHIVSQIIGERGLGPQDIAVRAAALAEAYTGRQVFNWRAATPDQIARYLASLGLTPGWRRDLRLAEMRNRSDRTANDASDGDGPSGYGAMDTRWDASSPHRLTEANWRNSPFAGVAGLDLSTAQRLLADGFTVGQIQHAGQDVQRLARHVGHDLGRLHISTPENIARAARLSRDAPAFMGHVHQYAEALSGIRTREAAIAQDRARLAQMEPGSAAATALAADITRREQEAARQRQEAQAAMDREINALPPERRPDGAEIVGSVREADAAAVRAAAEQARLVAQRQTEEAAARAARERAEREAAERARQAAEREAREAERRRQAALGIVIPAGPEAPAPRDTPTPERPPVVAAGPPPAPQPRP